MVRTPSVSHQHPGLVSVKSYSKVGETTEMIMLPKLENPECADRSWDHTGTATYGSKAQLGTGIMAKIGSTEIVATERRSARMR